MKVKKEGNDLISRRALMEEMSKISLDTEDDVRAWIKAELLVEDAPAVPDRAERSVRCAECDDCHWSEESGMYLCGNVLGMNGALDPGNGDGCSHGRK